MVHLPEKIFQMISVDLCMHLKNQPSLPWMEKSYRLTKFPFDNSKKLVDESSSQHKQYFPTHLLVRTSQHFQTIPHTRLCNNILWTRGVGFNFTAQVADIDSQQMHFAIVGSSPYLSEQMLMRDYFAGVLKQDA